MPACLYPGRLGYWFIAATWSGPGHCSGKVGIRTLQRMFRIPVKTIPTCATWVHTLAYLAQSARMGR